MTFETWFQSIHADIPVQSANAVLKLTEEGGTIPFIARYRKEVTKGLDERQLRAIEDLLAKAKELAARKNTILKTIAEQGKLTEALQKQIVTCMDPRVLEDLYLPYKPRKRTRAAIARERGLQPLADLPVIISVVPANHSIVPSDPKMRMPSPKRALLNVDCQDTVTSPGKSMMTEIVSGTSRPSFSEKTPPDM